VTSRITDETQTQIGTGGSLRVRPPARTLVAAKIRFVDDPNMNNPGQGYFGDLKFSPGERLGDIPLVAAGRFGSGMDTRVRFSSAPEKALRQPLIY
jgi:hypothetical protein